MKALHTLIGSEKARLLHDLFPQEIPALIDDVSAFCRRFSKYSEQYRQTWQDGFMPFDYWLSLSNETLGLINKFQLNMVKSSKVFADQLYFTYTAMFVTDRIIKYAEGVSRDEKFKMMVRILFM